MKPQRRGINLTTALATPTASPTTTTTPQSPQVCPVSRSGERTELNHFGALHRLAPSASAPPQHLHTGHQDLPPEDSVTPSFATPGALRVRPYEPTKNHYGATKDANETTESPPVAMDSMRAANTGGRQQVLLRGATTTNDMNNSTAKTAGQGGFTLLSLLKGANRPKSMKNKTSSGFVQQVSLRSWGEGRCGGGRGAVV